MGGLPSPIQGVDRPWLIWMFPKLGGAFKYFFIFTPIWGNDQFWRSYSWNGLKPPTRKIMVPQNGWFIMENPMNKWMIWGYPYFWKHPFRVPFTSGGMTEGFWVCLWQFGGNLSPWWLSRWILPGMLFIHVGEFGQKQLYHLFLSEGVNYCWCWCVRNCVDHRRKDVQNLTWINGLTR